MIRPFFSAPEIILYPILQREKNGKNIRLFFYRINSVWKSLRWISRDSDRSRGFLGIQKPQIKFWNLKRRINFLTFFISQTTKIRFRSQQNSSNRSELNSIQAQSSSWSFRQKGFTSCLSFRQKGFRKKEKAQMTIHNTRLNLIRISKRKRKPGW